MAKNSRASVSAEVFGKYHKKQLFVPVVITKSDQTMEKIKTRLLQAFMFMALDADELNVVIDAMDEKKVVVGETVIKEGEKGEVLYVVEEGTLECFKKFPD